MLRCHKKCTNLQIATEILSGCSQLQPLVPILEETYSKQGIAMGASSLLSWARLAAPCRDCRGRSCRARWGSPPSPLWSSPSWWRAWQAIRELLKIGWCPVFLQSKMFSWIEWYWKFAIYAAHKKDFHNQHIFQLQLHVHPCAEQQCPHCGEALQLNSPFVKFVYCYFIFRFFK